jgi:hypothetical protein
MTGNDYINEAKKFYPVETYLENSSYATFVNIARRKLIKYAKIGYTELPLSLSARTPEYTLSKNLLDLYSIILQWDDTIRYELIKIPYGRFPLSQQTFFAPPWNYSYIPPNKLSFYPCPDRTYSAYIYCVPFPDKVYTGTTLGDEDTDITTENYLEPLGCLIASQIARYDQNYEVSAYLDDLFFKIMGVSKL